MYERNAIVLERYFNKLFKYNDENNLKENYNNYCKLVENLEKFNIATDEETKATSDFEEATNSIKKIQKVGERLYNKSAKLEYSRYIVFENKEEKTEEIQNCLEKIEKDVEKNIESLKNLDKEFIDSSRNYKEKKDILLNCQKVNKEAKKEYEKILEKTSKTFENIEIEDIEFIKEFINSENKELIKELNEILTENGINERIPFDNDVISDAIDISFDIFKKEINLFLNGYEKTKKLLDEIQSEDAKTDKHQKIINDNICKLDFLSAEKDYIIGFLDNERIAAIYDKKTHRKLMLEACKNLTSDLEHINSLYELILKEATGRSSKRMYKDNYNINYLSDIEKVSEGVEENKIKANSVAVMNLNYWRIDGINRIQEIFEKDIKEIYGRDLEEIFPKEIIKEDVNIETEENTTNVENIQDVKEEKEEKKSVKSLNYKKLKSSKKVLGNALYSLRKNSSEDIDDTEIDTVLEEEKTEQESINENETCEEVVTEFENIIENDTNENSENEDYVTLFEKISKLDELDDLSGKSDDVSNEENEEESIIDFYFKTSNKEEKKENQDNRKVNIFKKLIGINSKSKKEAQD